MTLERTNSATIAPRRGRGVTLVEMLVAVAITVGMMIITGVVFKSSTDASGKAMASNDVMNQLRALTDQLERDLSGLRSDMPFAIVFQQDPWMIRVNGYERQGPDSVLSLTAQFQSE